MPKDKPELLPCPFCGGEVKTKWNGTLGFFIILCKKCDSFTTWGDNEIEAVEKWNTRNPPEPSKDEVEFILKFDALNSIDKLEEDNKNFIDESGRRWLAFAKKRIRKLISKHPQEPKRENDFHAPKELDKWKVNKVIKEWLIYFTAHVSPDMKVEFPNGDIIQYKGFPAISFDLSEEICTAYREGKLGKES